METHDPVDRTVEPVDGKTLDAIRFVADHPEIFTKQGAVTAGWRRRRGRRSGPYFRLAYRRDGKQRSVYLGRCEKRAELIRSLLQRMQRPVQEARALRKWKSSARAALRKCKADWDREVRKLGLRPQGFEIRGWKQGDTRNDDRSG
ncbi:MAG: hypothetical protein N2C14_01215 [Planctomycetales bacterium]